MKFSFARLFFAGLALFSIFFMNIASAKDLGVIGETYAILEDDFLQLIESRYQSMKTSGEWDKVQKAWQKKVMNFADRPTPVDGITTTTIHREYYFDPSIELSRDITGLNGEIIAKSGTVVNPLEMMTLHKTLLFIDADDPKQLVWAIRKEKEREGKTKWILVKGSIADTVKKMQREIYFDQGGNLTTHFKIKHVPAMLSQDGLSIKIMECLP